MIPGLGRSAREGIGYSLQYSWASLVAQLVKNLPAMQETWVSIPGLGRSPGERKGYPFQHSGLENSRECIVHGVTESDTTEQLSLSLVKNLPAKQETWVQSLGQDDPLEEEMAPHSSILAWIIPWTEEPGRLQPMGSPRVRHVSATK